MKYLIILLALILPKYSYATNVKKSNQEVVIEGDASNLIVRGYNGAEITITTEFAKNSILKKFTKSISKGVTRIDLLDSEASYQILVPIQAEVNCRLRKVIQEKSWYKNMDFANLYFSDLTGELEINVDLFHIIIKNTTNSITVLAYGDITASLPNLSKNATISLDSYSGSIEVDIDETLKPNIKATAKKGSVSIAGELIEGSFTENNTKALYIVKGRDGSNFFLHTENGESIKMRVAKTNRDTLCSHPNLRDLFIRIYIEDQGKLRMDNNARLKLSKMGYKEFIDSFPDIAEGHKYMQKHRDQLDKVVKDYGFPTKEMIGSDYSWSAIKLILIQAPKTYRSKYSKEIDTYFGGFPYLKD